MTTELQLYRVRVTQEWSAEATAMVWAPDTKTAETLAEREVEMSADDAKEIGPLAFAKPEPIDDGVLDRMDDDNLWLILPDGELCDNDRAGLARFRSFITPEQLEAMRLARIEAGNGQLSLMGAQA
jgi:hypothetical protein